LNPLPNILIL